MKKVTLLNDGERMVPELHNRTLLYGEHMTRYIAAQQFVKGKTVLDIACGSGYGTKILAKTAAKVYGVDINKDSVDYAKQNFAADNIEYRMGDAVKIPLEDESIDTIVTFETIEHVKKYRQYLEESKRVLKTGGQFIVSTPNKGEFAKGNEFHEHEFDHSELLKLLKSSFKFIDKYYQATWAYVQLSDESLIAETKQFDLTVHNFSPLKPERVLYFYFICSDKKISTKLKPIGGLGGHYSAKEFEELFKHYEKVIADYKQALETASSENEQLAAKARDLELEYNSILASRTYKLARGLSQAKNSIGKIGKR
jgi:ubiquinone/menaquinone biosynthesis C-methylase UbiE